MNNVNLMDIESKWDLVVIGGGITGAGILLEASKRGVKTILVEQKDFGWGTSSRSSKLVHGGLRYLKQGRIDLTYASVKEREYLVKDAEGLVEYLPFIMPVYSAKDKLMMMAGLAAYSFMAGKKQHRYYNAEELIKIIPDIKTTGLIGGFQFLDAKVDDARLTLRAIFEAASYGGLALNYTRAKKIKRNSEGMITGLTIEDIENGKSKLINTKAIINATGVWTEGLDSAPFQKAHIRPLRGSHIVFPYKLFPIKNAISFVHPDDRRPVFLIPWEGVTIYGTTDIDHSTNLMEEPHMSLEEFNYLIKGLNAYFPNIKIASSDCISTFSGIRPVLSKGGKDPSKESRDDIVFEDKGLVTITGGKLTIFRKLAHDALKAAKRYLPEMKDVSKKINIFKATDTDNIVEKYTKFDNEKLKILSGRYGEAAKIIIKNSNEENPSYILGTKTLWAELPYAAKHEKIRHLEDLMLRRVRIGNQLPEGGKKYLDQIQSLCETCLPWDKTKWEEEKISYIKLWNRSYSVP